MHNRVRRPEVEVSEPAVLDDADEVGGLLWPMLFFTAAGAAIGLLLPTVL